MKKFLIIAITMITAIIFFQYCNPNTKKSETGGKATTLVAGDDCGYRSGKDYTKPENSGEIDAQLAHAMSLAYSTDPYKGFMWTRGNESERTKDASSIWFELGKLKNLISTIENSVCDRTCKNPLKLGIRIYYAKYPENTGTNLAPDDLKHLPQNYAGRHTVFMVATYDNAGGRHVDFDPLEVGNKCAPTPYTALLSNGRPHRITGINGVRNVIAFDTDTSMNHGDLMPPPDSSGVFPTGGN